MHLKNVFYFCILVPINLSCSVRFRYLCWTKKLELQLAGLSRLENIIEGHLIIFLK